MFSPEMNSQVVTVGMKKVSIIGVNDGDYVVPIDIIFGEVIAKFF